MILIKIMIGKGDCELVCKVETKNPTEVAQAITLLETLKYRLVKSYIRITNKYSVEEMKEDEE